jgi:hypothetical protein
MMHNASLSQLPNSLQEEARNLNRTSRIQLPACADGVGVNQFSPAILEVVNPSLRCQRLETIQKLQHSQEVSGQHFGI